MVHIQFTPTKRLFYTMNHEVVPRPCKTCDWLLNSSREHYSLHQGNNVRVAMKFKVLERRILRTTLSIDMVQHILQWEKTREVVELDSFLFFSFQNYPFWGYIRYSSWSTFGLRLVRGPKVL
jgi:hypothetical protein